ncbi:MAG: ATP-binding protein [Planctomycetota bacterium]
MTDQRQSLEAENAALREAMLRLERRVRQLERMARTTHELGRQSKVSMLRANEQLVASHAQLEVAMREAEAAVLAKDRFLAAMSHEIRTPMNGVIGFIELLRGSALDAEQSRLIGTLGACADSLMALLNDVLDFAKLQADRIELERRPFGLHELANAILELELVRARSKGVSLRLELGPGLPLHVIGDGHRLRQVLTNLVNNAIKFTLEGGVTLRIGSTDLPDAVRFEVQDTGIGIPHERLGDIFEAFTQADEAVSRRFGGTGLGLSICRQLVQAMGGEIQVESTEGVGSMFSFELTLPGTSVVASAPHEHAAKTHHRSRVLVVDDHGVNRLLAQKLVERLGCSVVAVDSGAMAIEKASTGEFDIVLMDCSMPEMDGFEATRRIRALGSPAGAVAVVALTGHAMAGDRERCIDAGMDDYLSKPIRVDELRRVLDRLAGGRPREAA